MSDRSQDYQDGHHSTRSFEGDDEYEDDGNYGSAAMLDVEVLQAISKRVCYGTSAQPLPQITGSVELTVSPSPLTCYQNDLGPYDSVPPFTAS